MVYNSSRLAKGEFLQTVRISFETRVYSIFWRIPPLLPPGEYQPMSFGGKNMKRRREKGGKCKRKRKKGKRK
jgi:hypothetical protein